MPLNEQQIAVVNEVVNGNRSINVIARAGCGKTFTLVEGVIKAIVDNDKGDAIIMAFNKAAAVEFEHRIERMGAKYTTVDSGTVHSIGFRAWRRVAGKVKVDGWKVANIIDERARSIELYMQYKSAIRQLVSLAKQNGIGITAEIEDYAAWNEIYEHHDIDANGYVEDVIEAAIDVFKESAKAIYQVVDFDDMIWAPLYKDARLNSYDFVLIDEAQDTNTTRRMLALRMLKPNGRLIAVGDDRQAIYGFTGADADSLDLIREAMGSVELPLNTTYRCPKAVVAEANRLVPDLSAHESAPEGLVTRITEVTEDGAFWFENPLLVPLTASDVALCRNTKPLVEAAYSMIRRNVGCRVEGRDIGEGLIALATKWKRVRTLGDLTAKLDEYKLTEMSKWEGKKNAAKAQSIEDRCDTLHVIIDNLLSKGLTTVEDLRAHIRSLFNDTPEGETPKVFTLSTIHKSKGREWERVFFLHRNKTLPSRYATQEWQLLQESNLEYVAITRAKSALYFVD